MTDRDAVGGRPQAPGRLRAIAGEVSVDGLEPLVHEIDEVRALARDEHMTDQTRGRLLREKYDVYRTNAREMREREQE